jgi:tetratricopeptide (TPR) repeat protein
MLGAAPTIPGDRARFRTQVAAALRHWQRRVVACAADVRALDGEHDNLIAALRWALPARETRDDALALLAALREVVLRRGQAANWHALLAQAARVVTPSENGVRVLELAAQVADRYLAHDEAAEAYQRALAICQQAGLDALGIDIDVEYGRHLIEYDHLAEGTALLQRDLLRAEQAGRERAAAIANLALAFCYSKQHAGQVSLEYARRALAIAENLHDADLTGRILIQMVRATLRTHDWETFWTCLARAEEQAARAGSPRLQLWALHFRGMYHFEQEDFLTAADCFRQAYAICVQIGELREMSAIHQSLAAAHWGLRQWETMERHYEAAIRYCRMMDNTLQLIELLQDLAGCYLDESKPAAAARTSAEAAARLAPYAGNADWDLMRARQAALEARLNDPG